MQVMAAVFGFSVFLAACNNSDESANNSSSPSSESSVDTLNTSTVSDNNATAANSPPNKRKGRAAIAIKTEDQTVTIQKDKMGIYNRAEVAPSYSGNLETFIQDNIEYPQEAIDRGAEGTVQVQFVVDENGRVTNVSTLGNKLGYGLEEAATKVVSKMPAWAPGTVNGKKVKTWRTLPITYQLDQ